MKGADRLKDRGIFTNPDRLEEAFRKAKFELELEGFVFTEEDEQVVKAVARGEMTREELIERLKQGN